MVRNAGALFYITSDVKPEEIRPWAAALYKQREDNFRRETDGIACRPPGPKAGIAVGGYPMKIVQTPNPVVILYEYQTLFRQIFTDGRALPQDANPTWMGYSVGRWDGDTLVVTTAGYNDRTTLDLAGHPHTEALRVTERFHRRDAGHIDLQVAFDDPKAYKVAPKGPRLGHFRSHQRTSGATGKALHRSLQRWWVRRDETGRVGACRGQAVRPSPRFNSTGVSGRMSSISGPC